MWRVRSASRLPWIDHLRTFVIVLVVNMHVCVTYSHVGSWYYMSDREPTLAAKLPFILWQAHLQSFFMGLLFFVAGYFAHGSLARRGSAAFVRERFFRLGLPTLLYMLVIHPFILLGLNPWHAHFGPALAYYSRFVWTGRFLGASGPLWFAIALLIFCLILAIWRTVRPFANPASDAPDSSPSSTPSAGKIWLFAAALGLITFVVRLVQPLGTDVLNLQLCFFPQYIAFFSAGVLAGRGGWLLPLAASPQARCAGWIALIGGPVVLSALLVTGAKAENLATFNGGWHWNAFGLALWEQFAGVGLSLGGLALFSRCMNRESAALRWLSDRAFGVYVLHPPVLVALAMAYRSLPQNPIPLAALLTVSGLVITFVLADATRRTPGLRAIL
jgi:peptidoglycan/LPS O-acetylase OafA/YrhL